MLLQSLAAAMGLAGSVPAAEPAGAPVDQLEWDELPDPEEDPVGEAPEDTGDGAEQEPEVLAAEAEPTPEDDTKPTARIEMSPPPPVPSTPPPDDTEPSVLGQDSPPDPVAHPSRAPASRSKSAYPQTWISLGILANKGMFGLGLSGTRFVFPALGLGLEIEDAVWWNDNGTFNVFRLTPKATLLVLPRFNVTPLFRAGFGGEFFSHDLGSYGRWVGGAGILFRFRTRWYAEVSVEAMGRVPDGRFDDKFKCVLTSTPCSLTLEPQLGLGLGF